MELGNWVVLGNQVVLGSLVAIGKQEEVLSNLAVEGKERKDLPDKEVVDHQLVYSLCLVENLG